MAWRSIPAVAAIVVTALLAAASSAQAVDRHCGGAIGAETVRGNLRVPAGAACDLAGTRVIGDTLLEAGAELVADQADLRGALRAGPEGYVDLFESTVAGPVVLTESLGMSTESSSTGRIRSIGSGFIDLRSGAVEGDLEVRGGPTAVSGENLTVGGILTVAGVEYLDLFDATVDGEVYVRDTQSGSLFCGNEVNGKSEFTGNRVLLTIGSPDQACEGNRVYGNVIVVRNQAETEISGNDVKGSLRCSGNEPAPVGGGNRVRIHKEGQCRAL